MFPVIQYVMEFDEDLGNFVAVPAFHGNNSTNSYGSINLKYDPDAGDTLIIPLGTNAIGSPETLHNAEDGADLEVPTGKKWTAVLIFATSGASATTFKVRGSTAADTDDGTTPYDKSSAMGTNDRVTTPVLEFAAGEFLTIVEVTNSVDFLGGIIVESDA